MSADGRHERSSNAPFDRHTQDLDFIVLTEAIVHGASPTFEQLHPQLAIGGVHDRSRAPTAIERRPLSRACALGARRVSEPLGAER
jgi:hypothetical protein